MKPVRFLVNFIFKASISTHNKKMYGEITSPCGTTPKPYIFLLCVEILALKIKFTKNLTLVIFAKKEDRAKIFADDLSV